VKTPVPPVRALRWEGEAPGGRLVLLDQTRLPEAEVELRLDTVAELVAAIRRLVVRGAPALGCTGAYGVVLAGQAALAADDWLARVETGATALAAARPTAVNLALGIRRVLAVARRQAAAAEPEACCRDLLAAARAFHAEDEALCAAIGRHGAALLPRQATVLTHCNTGCLATGGLGTALAVIYTAHAGGGIREVLADETRPLLQGARLTAWELRRAGIPVRVLCDGAAAGLLRGGRVDAVLVGADRVAANGDVANKVGTYPLALAARAAGVPFYVAAPTTTVDLACPDGAAIPIEERDPEEVLGALGRRWTPAGVGACNPAFDVTPGELVSALVSERGVLEHPDRATLAALLGAGGGAGGQADTAASSSG